MSSSRTSARKGSSQRAPFTPTVRFALTGGRSPRN